MRVKQLVEDEEGKEEEEEEEEEGILHPYCQIYGWK